MSYVHTIALARSLMADGHFDAVEQMVGPLLGRSDIDPPEEVVLRCILAGSWLLSTNNFERANALLAPYSAARVSAGLPEDVRIEVNTWIGWSLANGGATDIERRNGLSLLSEVIENAGRRSNMGMLVWALAGYVEALDGFGAPGLAQSYARRLSLIANSISVQALSPIVNKWSKPDAAAIDNSTPTRKTANATLASDILRVESAAHAGLSVLILGEPGVGKRALARQLVSAGATQTVEISATDFDSAEQQLIAAIKQGASISVVVFDADQLRGDHQERLLQSLSAVTQPRLRSLVSTASSDPRQSAPQATMLHELAVRISCARIEIGPLRQRREDVEVIVRSQLSSRLPGEPTAAITDRALETLRQADWPGNDRELIDVIDTLRSRLAVDPSPVIDIKHLSEGVTTNERPRSTLHRWIDEEFSRNKDLETVLAHAERLLIESTLTDTGGQVSAAAELLGLTRQGLYKKMKRLEVDPARFHDNEGQSQHANDLMKEYEEID